MNPIARHYRTGRWVGITTQGRMIADVSPAEGPETVGAADEWVAPAFWDIQTNGRWGVSFSDPDLAVDQVAMIVRAQGELGTARLCPTLISAPIDHLRHGLATIAEACATIPDVDARVAGIHLEGPYISGVDGYRGAHPLGAVHDPDWDEFRRLQDAAAGRIVVITLAPERPGALAFIAKAVAAGVVVALAHTAADGPTLHAAASAGASLSTHLGNGIAAHLPRHPNPIWHQAADDRLQASLIADGHHLDPATLRVLVRAKTPERIILVSDASPLAGLPPGRYGPWAVDLSGKIVVADTPYLAGSNQALDVGLGNLIRAAGLSPAQALDTVTSHPARLLGRPAPTLEPGQPADLVRFRCEAGGDFTLLATCIDGRWIPARHEPPVTDASTPPGPSA